MKKITDIIRYKTNPNARKNLAYLLAYVTFIAPIELPTSILLAIHSPSGIDEIVRSKLYNMT